MTNSYRFTLPLLAACALLPASGLFAQSPAAAPTDTASPVAPAATMAPVAEAHPGRETKKERMEALTPEERQKVKAARQAALQDPTVKAAEATKNTDHRGYTKAVREAMLKADPSIEPILKKLHGEHRQH